MTPETPDPYRMARDTTSDRQSQLDALRAFGLITVVFVHTMHLRGPVYDDLGPMAMSLFFVLSGFLISGLLFDGREKAERLGVPRGTVLRRFYIRRFLRIFPIYYAVILAAYLLGEPVTRQYIWQLVTYQTNFLVAANGNPIPPITPFWSLAVEEHFYLVWPLIALFGSRAFIWRSAIAMVVISVVARFALKLNGLSYNASTLPTYTSLDGIALGCILALVWRERNVEERAVWVRRALIAGLTMETIRLGLYLAPDSISAKLAIRTLHTLPTALICIWVVDRGAQDRLPAFLRHKVLAYLGLISYGAYVMHRYLIHAFGYDKTGGLRVFAVVLVTSIGLAIVSWTLFERPINELKRFWPYVPKPKAVVATDASMAAA